MFTWMVNNDHLDPVHKPVIQRIKNRTKFRDEANPAFLPDDWKAFKDVLYKFDQGHDNEYETWRRRWFINYVRFMYQGGFRPHEARKIRFGDVEISKNRKDGKPVAIIQIDADTKTGRRDAVMNGNTFLNVKSHLNKGIKIRNKQINLMNEKLLKGNKKVLDFHNRLHEKILPEVHKTDKDDLVLMNPFLNGKRRIYHDSYIRDCWNMVIGQCDFKNRYTLYSLRSTHISYQLLQGISVNKVAKNVGTSMAMIQMTYDRLSSRYSIDELGFFKDTNVPKEEDILTSQNLIKKGLVIDKLLDSLIVTEGIKCDDLVLGDKNAVMVAARVLAYGPEYECEVTNPNTEKTFNHTFNLADCPFKKIPDDVQGNKFELELAMNRLLAFF